MYYTPQYKKDRNIGIPIFHLYCSQCFPYQINIENGQYRI